MSASARSPVAALTICALGGDASGLLSYGKALGLACVTAPPPFGCAWYGEKYREFASDADWVAGSLVANAEKEGYGSRTLWKLAGGIRDPRVSELVKQHAVDESRHSLMYLSLLDAVFPAAADDALSVRLKELSPRYSASQALPASREVADPLLLDEIVQMNLGEIRTRIHQLLMRPVLLAIASERALPRVERLVAALIEDETRHIRYTARIIEDAMGSGQSDYVRDVMSLRLREFNEITLAEVGERRFVGE